jgi:hypothetical protein
MTKQFNMEAFLMMFQHQRSIMMVQLLSLRESDPETRMAMKEVLQGDHNPIISP